MGDWAGEIKSVLFLESGCDWSSLEISKVDWFIDRAGTFWHIKIKEDRLYYLGEENLNDF